jgi:hypothetical protein
MRSLSDDDVSGVIACSSWERLEAVCRAHAEALAELEEACTLENLAVVSVTESILAAISARRAR